MNRLLCFFHSHCGAGLIFALPLVACAAVVFLVNLVSAQDLSSLPEYKPEQKVSGVLRSWGNKQMATLMKYWEEGFRKYHPEVFFTDNLKGSASAMLGLGESV